MLRMIADADRGVSLRLERLEFSRLGWAFAISLAVHLTGWGVYSGGTKLGLWEKLHLPAWVQKLTQPIAQLFQAPTKPLFQETEPPLMFVNVNPDTATTEPPKDAKYYSNLNSKAANPKPEHDTDAPEFPGQQDLVPETENVPRNNFDRLQPVAPARKPQEAEEPEKRKPTQAPGDLALAKPDLNPRRDPGDAEKERPRRLSQVDPSKFNRPPAEMMRQKGGVRTELTSPSLDTKSTVTGNYDWLFIQAVKSRWLDLLEGREMARGYVRLKFKLHHDGKVTDMTVLENTVTETLSYICQASILQLVPFDPWTREMRQVIGRDYRDITFTFYYY